MIRVGIDIGNSKISCVVCDVKNDQKPNILSFISLPTNNISKNSFTNYNSLKNEILEVIQKSAKESQTEIKSINLNIPLSSSISYYYESNIKVINENNLFKLILHCVNRQYRFHLIYIFDDYIIRK